MTITTRNEVLVTCDNTPLMELLEHLAKDHAPDLDYCLAMLDWYDGRDSLERVAALQAAIGGPGVTAKLMESEYQDKIDRLKLAVDVVKEDYDEAQKQLEKLRDERDSSIETSSLLRRNVEELKDIMSRHGVSRPALPEGMRIAESETWGRVVVSPKADEDDEYMIFFLSPEDKTFAGSEYDHTSDLTFLDSEPVPSVLTTVEDLENAPLGTVIAFHQGSAYQKVYNDYWESFDDELKTEEMAAKGPWKILRWGWGE